MLFAPVILFRETPYFWAAPLQLTLLKENCKYKVLAPLLPQFFPPVHCQTLPWS